MNRHLVTEAQSVELVKISPQAIKDKDFVNHSKGLLSCSSTIIFADVARSGEW